MSRQKNFAVFDGDAHVVEPRTVWEQYLDPEYRVLGKHALWREDGKTNAYLKINGEIHRDTTNINLPRHALWRPGMTWESVGELDPDVRHAMNEGAWEPQARLRDMDAMGVDQTLLYPTWFAEGFHLVHDPDVAYALARAYNHWIADFCRAAPERLFAVAMVPLQNMDFTLEELQWVADIPCFRAAFIRPMFIEGHYFTHPYYDPLWAELERLGLTAAVHPTPGLWNPEWTSHGPFFEKIRDRLHQPSRLPGGRRTVFGRRQWDTRDQFFYGRDTPRPSGGADSIRLVGQPSIRCLGPDWLYRDAALSRTAICGGARQSVLDGGSAGENGGFDKGHSPVTHLSGTHGARGAVGRGSGHVGV